ncbi:MAG TPA: SRPBCC domain-containing protein, partial [Terriglobales bacterium]|nr:SRPBCC domain-containing protein [Terriglobales bacterium]
MAQLIGESLLWLVVTGYASIMPAAISSRPRRKQDGGTTEPGLGLWPDRCGGYRAGRQTPRQIIAAEIMSGSPERATCVTRHIAAPAATIYAAFMDPAALVAWLPPGEMTGGMHRFDGKVGGGYRMSL